MTRQGDSVIVLVLINASSEKTIWGRTFFGTILLTNNSGDFNTAYTYNMGGMVTELTTQNGDTAIQSHSYTYLPNGNISGKQSTVGTQTTNYAYVFSNIIKGVG